MTQDAREDDAAPASEMLPAGELSVDTLPRAGGTRAEISYVEARLADAIDAGDAEGERTLSIDLAKKLAARGTDLGEALRLAERALELGDDRTLASELSGWLGGVGEPARAAHHLERLADQSKNEKTRARSLMRAAVLRARAADATLAHADLLRAADEDKKDAIPHELIGTLSSWSEVPAEVSALAYLDAAARREAAGDEDAAFEDRLRAFATSPGSPIVAETLAEALIARGRPTAADEVLVARADVLPDVARMQVHLARLDAALERGDLVGAVTAVFDAGIEIGERAALRGPDLERKVDDVLARAGMFEIVASRYASRARREAPSDARTTYEALARLSEGQLGRPDLMVTALVDAVVADPGARTTRTALLDHATKSGDSDAVVEALVRVGTSSAESEGIAATVDELAHFAEERLADASLALWGYERLGRFAKDKEGLLSARARLEPGARTADAEIAEREATLRAATGSDPASRQTRVDALGKLVRLYRSKPHAAARELELLVALVRAEPTRSDAVRAFSTRVERKLAEGAATADLELFASVLGGVVDAPVEGRTRVAARLLLSRVLSALDPSGRTAVAAVAPIVEGASPDLAAVAQVLEIATRYAAPRERGLALAALADGLSGPVAAIVLAAASEALAAAGDAPTALRLAEKASSAAPSLGKPARALAHAAMASVDKEAAAALETALGVLVPSVDRCAALAAALDKAHEPMLAVAWTERWLALRPASRDALRELARRAVDLADAARLGSTLGWILAQPEPAGSLVDALIDGLRALFALDASKAKPLARRALDVFGPKEERLRRELIALADEHGDKGLAIAAMERWLATATDAPVATLLELCVRRCDAADYDGAARELCRAASFGTTPEAVLESVHDVENAAGGALSGDGRIWLAEALARSQWELSTESTRERAIGAFRALGALRWDLAEDWRGSEQALFAASEAGAEVDLYARDLVELAGIEQAMVAIRARAGAVEGKGKARVLTAAARQLAENGLDQEALSVAEEALLLDPSMPDAIAIAEACAHGDEGARAISRIYDGLANAAMGIYGQRAAHYRAARQLERRAALPLAVEHAIASFEAVPNEGTSYSLLTRLVERTGDFGDAVRALERVAEASRHEERGLWLNRAAALAPASGDGLATRLDLLLRALLVEPDSKTVGRIEETILAMIAAGDDAEHCHARFERALRAIVPKLEGPDGAYVSIRLTRAAITLERPALAHVALARALKVDAGHGAFADLLPQGSALAAPDEEARRSLALILASQTAGTEALGVGRVIAERLGDSASVTTITARLDKSAEDALAPAMETFDLTDDPEPPPAKESVQPSTATPPMAASPLSALPTTRRSPSGVRPLAPEIRRTDPSPSIESALASFGENFVGPPSDEAPPSSEPAAIAREAAPPPPPSPEASVAKREAPPDAPSTSASDVSDHLQRVARLAKEHPADAELEVEKALEAAGGTASASESIARVVRESFEPARAASLWDRLSKQPARSESQRVEFGLKAVDGYTVAKDANAALHVLDRLSSALPQEVVSELRVSAARTAGDPLALTLALDDLASTKSFETEQERALVLLEAAQASLAGGDEPGALIRARRAMRLDPTNPVAVIEVARLEYRARGTGTPREAQATVDALVAVEANLPSDLVELHGFLLAEELDVIQGGGAGMRELTHRHAEIGPLPLIALGMAERLARNRTYEAAVPLFEKALAGDLRGLRNLGRVSAAAADAAIHAGSLELGAKLLDEAEKYPETRGIVERKRRELEAASPDHDVAEKALLGLIASSSGLARARFLERLATIREGDAPEMAVSLYEEALGAARNDRTLSERIRKSLVILRSKSVDTDEEVTSTGRKVPSAEELGLGDSQDDTSGAAVLTAAAEPPLPIPPSIELSVVDSPVSSHGTPLLESAPSSRSRTPLEAADATDDARAALSLGLPPNDEEPPPSVAPVSRVPSSRAIAALWPTIEHASEEDLFLRLIGGDTDAGDQLIASYEANRTRDILVVRRHQAAIRPGNRGVLEAVHGAALADGSTVYARALENILTLGAAGRPPPLSAQALTPELVQRLLFRDLAKPTTDALALVLDSGMMRKDAAAAGITGATRVAPGPGNPVSEAMAALVPSFGARPLYHLKKEGPPKVGVALLATPSVVYEGDVRAWPEGELFYRLAAQAAAASPEFAIVVGESEANVRQLIDAIVGAFGPVTAGPPSSGSGTSRAAIARIGSELWQRLLPPAERRIRALVTESTLSYEDAQSAGQAAMRRAGLFACGDLAVAIAVLLGPAQEKIAPEDLEALCRERSDIADLVRFALRMEYAEARFHNSAASPPPLRRPGSSIRGG